MGLVLSFRRAGAGWLPQQQHPGLHTRPGTARALGQGWHQAPLLGWKHAQLWVNVGNNQHPPYKAIFVVFVTQNSILDKVRILRFHICLYFLYIYTYMFNLRTSCIQQFFSKNFASTNTPAFVSDTQQPYEDVLSSNSSLCRVTRITQSSHCHLHQNL